ncbi:MAG: PHP domain-containing protein [bacterium]
MKIDLHSHTSFSDGRLSPEKLVSLAKKRKVDVLSVTDHDTVEGLPQIQLFCEEAGIEWIPGIEISSRWGEEEVHLLAYFIDWRNAEFLNFLEEQRRDRLTRLDAMIARLNEHGVLIEKKDVEATLIDTRTPGRPHVAQALVRLGYAPNMKEAFRLYLSPGNSGYVPRAFPEASSVLQKIKNCGGIASLAHPGLLRNKSIPDLLKNEGLPAIEAYHPNHKKSQMQAFAYWAKENGLLVTGGSDFHGLKGEKNSALGSLPMPVEALEKLRNAAHRQNHKM